MTVTAVRKDPQTLTMTIEAEFNASPERVWQLWADPRQLERWWGPPAYSATFTRHDLTPGGRVGYHMTGPGGDQPHAYWDVLETEAPHRLVFREGVANADGTPNTDRPRTPIRVRIEDVGNGHTRMSIQIVFPSAEDMRQVLAVGTDEGLPQAVSQIDAILAEDAVTRHSGRPGRTLEGGPGFIDVSVSPEPIEVLEHETATQSHPFGGTTTKNLAEGKHTMGQLIVTKMVTIDGVAQAPSGADEDRRAGSAYGGWQAPYVNAEAGNRVFAQASTMDAPLLGRRTYEISAGRCQVERRPVRGE